MVVADLAGPFPLAEVHDCGVLETLGDFSLSQHLLEERRQKIHKVVATVLVDLSRDLVRSGRPPAGELLHGLDGFVERGREVEVHALCLLSEQGTAVGAEKRSNSFGWQTVDSLDRVEVILPFVAVHVPLDLLGLASFSSVLHPPQSLLQKATTTVESCFVVVGGAVDVGLVQMVLLGEQVADGDLVVVKPVLVLATCATEDSQGRRLDCAPQVTPSVLNECVLVGGSGGNDWNVG
ncbi:hypothetical protein SprV_0100221500 [Sparganum proliferum]